MQTQGLKTTARTGTGKGAARKLRAAAQVPGVVYGKGLASNPIAIDRKAFEILLRNGGHHGLIDLSLDGESAAVKALVREIQVHPVSRQVEHVDLQRVSMTERVRIDVPIVLVGKPEGVRTQGGILEQALRSVEVECLPADIPEKIEIDVTALTIGHSVHVSDLVVPGVTILAHAEAAVAIVSVPAAERSAEETAAEAAAAAGVVPAEGAEAAPGAPGAEAKAGEKPGAKPGEKPGAKGAEKPAGKESKGGKS